MSTIDVGLIEDLVEAQGPGDAGNGLKPWEPKKLNSRHKQIIAMSAAGVRNKDIADLLGMSQSRVSVILNDPRSRVLERQLASDVVSQIATDVSERIQGAAGEAFDVVKNLMDNADSERVRQTSAFDILDRAGFKPKETTANLNLNVDGDQLETLVEVLKEVRERPPVLEHLQDSSDVFRDSEHPTSARK
jgi:predicted transcriptional regulator